MDAMKPLIKAIGTGQKLARDLTIEEATRAMELILTHQATEAQTGAFLQAMRIKGETVEELLAFTQVAQRFIQPIHVSRQDIVNCAYPYDGKKDSPLIQVAAAFLAAECGAAIFFHGESQIPPKRGTGPGDVLAQLEIDIHLPSHQVKELLERTGVGFLLGSKINPTFFLVRRIREELNLRTSLNNIEKLWNLVGAPYIISGIFHGGYLETMTKVVLKLGYRHGVIFQGMEGGPDCRISSPTKGIEVREGQLQEIVIKPSEFGFQGIPDPRLEGLTQEKAAEWLIGVLQNRGSPDREIVILNAAILLYVAEKFPSIQSAILPARASLESGRAWERFEIFRRMSQKLASGLRAA